MQLKSGTNKHDSLLNRREFLIAGAGVTAGLLSSCSLSSNLFSSEPMPRRAYELPHNKIQPPQDGLLFGFHGLFDSPAPYFTPTKQASPDWAISVYERELGYKPDILTRYSISCDQIFGYSNQFMEMTSQNGSIPFNYLSLIEPIGLYGSLRSLVDNKEFIKSVEKEALWVRENKIPHFVSTMRELNGSWFPWGKQASSSKKVWILMWHIFEDNGANEYATWVWEPYVTHHGNTDNPEKYYPGDEYVDWIGLSAYSRSKYSSGKASLASIIYPTYKQLYDNHENTPLMIAEYGKTRGFSQDGWLDTGLRNLLKWDIRAAIYWNNANINEKDDHTLSKDSLQVFSKYMKIVKG